MNQPIRQDAMIADSLSRFVRGSTYDSIPREVRERAKCLILDAVGIAYASSTYESARTTLRALGSLGAGDGDVIGFSERLTLRRVRAPAQGPDGFRRVAGSVSLPRVRRSGCRCVPRPRVWRGSRSRCNRRPERNS